MSKSETTKEPEFINPYMLFQGVFIPNWLLQDQKLTSSDKIIYIKMYEMAKEKNQTSPSQETLAKECGVSIRTVVRSIQHLIDYPLLRVEKSGEGNFNAYYFINQ